MGGPRVTVHRQGYIIHLELCSFCTGPSVFVCSRQVLALDDGRLGAEDLAHRGVCPGVNNRRPGINPLVDHVYHLGALLFFGLVHL